MRFGLSFCFGIMWTTHPESRPTDPLTARVPDGTYLFGD